MKEVNSLVGQLYEGLNETLESHYCEWLDVLLKTDAIRSFMDLAELPIHFVKLTELLGLDPAKIDHPYAYSKDLGNLVDFLASLWKAKFGFEIFSIFDAHFRKGMSSTFVFQKQFLDVVYSHTRDVVFAIIVVIFLTYPNETDHEVPVFEESIEGLPKNTFESLKPNLAILFDELAEAVSEQAKKADVSQEKKPFVDKQMFARLEAQQVQIQALEQEREEQLVKTAELEKKIADMVHELEEKEKQVRNLTYTRDDMFEKLKNRNAEIVSEEVRERDAEIKHLKDDLQDVERKRSIEAQQWRDDKDSLMRRLQMLDNIRADFESKVEESAGRTSDEDAAKLREKLAEVQNQYIGEKERCINLEIECNKLQLDIAALKNSKQDLEFKVRELGGEAQNTSDIYDEDYDRIEHDLNPESELKQLKSDGIDGEELMSPTNSRTAIGPRPEDVIKSYQSKCLGHIKRLCLQISEQRSRLEEALRELEASRETNEELTERCTQVEARVVGDFIENNVEIKKLFDFLRQNCDSSEVAQTMLQKILKMEHEIQRQAANRRRLLNEGLERELKALEHVQTIFSVVSAYVKN